MKKLLALALITVMMFALAIPALAYDNPLSDNMVTLPTAPKADIVIDGVRDDGYGDMFEVNSFRGDPGASGKVWAAWNEKGVFYYVEVNDTTPNHEHGNSYERDCIEFFIDWNATHGDTLSNDDDIWQVRIASAPNEDGQWETCGQIGGGSDETLVAGTDFVIKPLVGGDLKGGYIMEVCLPVSLSEGNSIKPLAEGREILVDFQVADNQEDSGRTSQAFLVGDDDEVDNQWQWPYAFRGILNLGPAKAAPVVDVPEVPEPDGGDVVVDVPVVAPPPAAKTGDSMIMLIVLVAALAGAFVITKRVKN